MLALTLSRSWTVTRMLIRNPAIPSDKPSNRESINTGVRSSHTTPALTLVGCGKTITDYKGKHSRELPSNMSLPNELYYLYARLEQTTIVSVPKNTKVICLNDY